MNWNNEARLRKLKEIENNARNICRRKTPDRSV